MAEAVIPPAVATIKQPFGTLLVAAIGAPLLPATGLPAALFAAVAVSAIAVREEENRVAAFTEASPLPQNRFAVNHRHASSDAGLDNGSGLVAG